MVEKRRKNKERERENLFELRCYSTMYIHSVLHTKAKCIYIFNLYRTIEHGEDGGLQEEAQQQNSQNLSVG